MFQGVNRHIRPAVIYLAYQATFSPSASLGFTFQLQPRTEGFEFVVPFITFTTWRHAKNEKFVEWTGRRGRKRKQLQNGLTKKR